MDKRTKEESGGFCGGGGIFISCINILEAGNSFVQNI